MTRQTGHEQPKHPPVIELAVPRPEHLHRPILLGVLGVLAVQFLKIDPGGNANVCMAA